MCFCNKAIIANEKMEKLLKFVNDGYGYIATPSLSKDFILILGETGVGKTPFTKWMTVDNSLLESEQLEEDGPFLMRDYDKKIGTAMTVSATIYPEAYMSNDSTIYYDFPGFKDTRGSDFELGNAFFTKRVVDRGDTRVKIVILASYDSVKSGGSRNEFMNLLTDVSAFIQNFEKFRNSMALVVTKVPKYINDRQMNDEAIIRKINQTMQKIIEEQKNNTQKSREMEIITTLLDKIGIFRYPDKSGLFSDIEILRPGKLNIENLIKNKLNFTAVSENDIGYSISEKAQLFVVDLLNRIVNNELYVDISNICERIKAHCFNEINNAINNLGALNASISDIKAVLQLVNNNNAIRFIHQLLDTKIYNLDFSTDANKNLEYVTFLLKVRTLELTTPSKYLIEINNASDNIWSAYQDHIDSEIKNLIATLVNVSAIAILRCADFQEKTADVFVVYDYIKYIYATMTTNSLNVVYNYMKANYGWHAGLYNTIRDLNDLNLFSFSKVNTLLVNNLKTLRDAATWYEFLCDIYNNYATVENATLNANVLDLIDKINGSHGVIKHIAELNNLTPLMGNLTKVENMTVTDVQIKRLKYLLTELFDHRVKCSDNNSTLIASGFTIKMSDVTNAGCWATAKKILIFALGNFDIDETISRVGDEVQMFIIANTWRVSGGAQSIILNGSDAQQWEPNRANNGTEISANGENGKPGRPGGSSGHFVGIGTKFIQLDRLTISTVGGRGGTGQGGGHGL